MLLASALLVSLYLAVPFMLRMATGQINGVDWVIFTTAGERITAGLNPYAFGTADHNFKWSPLLAYGFALIAPIGVWGWTALALGSLALLGDWRLIAAFLVAYPLWSDLYSGASFWIVPLVAILALRSDRWALGFVALAVLIPRPLMLPMLAWLTWQRPHLRLPALAVAGVLLVASFATGWGDEWIAQLASIESGGGASVAVPLWLTVLLLPVTAWLIYRGWIGAASLLVTPYILPSYLLMLLVVSLPRAAAPAGSESAPPARHTSSGPDPQPSGP